jgi:hypothetical protein
VADDLAPVLDNLYDAITDHPTLKQVADLVKQVQYIDGYLRFQESQRGESVVDEVVAKLADYQDVLGKEHPRHGTPQFEARNKLAAALVATRRAWEETGIEFSREDLDQHAGLVAKKFWGERTPAEPAKVKEETKPAPPQDPETGRFVPRPTATARPTQRQGMEVTDERTAAVAAVAAKLDEYRRNGDL